MTNICPQVLALIQPMVAVDGDPEENVPIAINYESAALALDSVSGKHRHRTAGRTWQHVRNNRACLFNYALQTTFIASSAWRSLFRISLNLFEMLMHDTRMSLTKTETNFRAPLPLELRLSAFLMYCRGYFNRNYCRKETA